MALLHQQADYLASQDPVMASLVQSIPAPEPLPRRDPYLALLEAIVNQQLSVKAAATIWQRFLALFEQQPLPERLLNTDGDTLRQAGLSRQKVRYVHAVAAYARQGSLTAELLDTQDDQTVIRELTSIDGVGRWTAEMMLMFALGRDNVFAVDDLVIRQVMSELYGVDASGAALRRTLEQMAEPWAPYRTLACRYLWLWREGRSGTGGGLG